jgi:thiol-disulfide isomerase/thioredoxin
LQSHRSDSRKVSNLHKNRSSRAYTNNFARRFSDTYPDARFYKLDVDEVPDVAQELSVRAMPTFMLFKDGEKVGEVVGANPTALETAIKNNV